jgi:hypothetical protein
VSQFWQQRIHNANKYYTEWATKFKCESLEQYYEGNQWKGRRDYLTVNYNPYMLNLVYATIKDKLGSLVFQKPSFLISPRPGGQDWNPDLAAQSAELKQDVLNTIIQNPNAKFAKIAKRVARDSFLRFGILEIGYAADWRNPLKSEPLFKDHGEDLDDKAKIISNEEVPINERFYFKRINPKRFRVAVSDAEDLENHEWCGYYDFYYTKTLRKTKGIKFPSDYQDALVSADFTETNLFSGTENQPRPDFLRLLTEGEISRVWNIWDMTEKKRLLLLDDNFEELWSTDCDRLPFKDIRWDERLEGFYPVPPVFQWLSPQDDINEAREQTRSFRRRFTRKFFAVKDAIEDDEIQKFTSGPDGIVVMFKQPDAIGPIQNPEQGQTAENDLALAKDDFYTISGNSSNIQATDRQTATASKIVDARAQVRESAEQMDFSVWLCEIGRETLTQIQEYLIEPLWVKYTTSPDSQAVLQDMQVMAPAYKQVHSQEISDGYDFEIDIDVMNQTPAAMQAQQQAFVTFTTLIHQFPELAMSPILIRKAAMVSGMRDEKVIHQMQQVALLSMAAKAAQQAAGQGKTLSQVGAPPNGDNVANAQTSQMASPTADQTTQQLNQQLM